MKKIFIVFVVLAILLSSIGIFKDQLIKSAVTILLSNVTGTRIHINGLSFGLFNSKVKIKGFKIYNPKGFPERAPLLDLQTINVYYDLGSLLKKKIYLKNLVIDLKEAVVVRDKEGKLNVDSLKVSKKENEAIKPDNKASFQIDILTLSLGRVIYEDFSREGKPSIEAFDLGIKNRVYKNITSAEQLITLLLVESLKSTTIRSAQIYGAASIIGASMLPVGLGYMLTRKDDATDNFKSGFEKAYLAAIKAFNFLGEVTREDKAGGKISGKIGLTEVIVKIEKSGLVNTKVTVSARKIFLPEPRIAGGLLYKISENLAAVSLKNR